MRREDGDENARSRPIRGKSWRNRLEIKAQLVHRRQNGRTVQPDLERFFAKRMGATTTEAASSHVVMLSQPQVVNEDCGQSFYRFSDHKPSQAVI
jgi:hypothetical protein